MFNDVERRIKEIIAKQLMIKPEEVKSKDHFVENLGADSLDIVELVMTFEEEFGIEIPDQEIEKIATVGQAIKYIKKRIKNRES